MEHCDFLVKLPIEGEVASLNVAQAATACMYECFARTSRTTADAQVDVGGSWPSNVRNS